MMVTMVTLSDLSAAAISGPDAEQLSVRVSPEDSCPLPAEGMNGQSYRSIGVMPGELLPGLLFIATSVLRQIYVHKGISEPDFFQPPVAFIKITCKTYELLLSRL